MSNLIVRLLALVLTAGLAIAGAAYFGGSFRHASDRSVATAILSQMRQVSDAVDMYRLKTGRPHAPAIETDFLVPRFLKAQALNPSPIASGRQPSYAYKTRLSVWAQGYDVDGGTADGRQPDHAVGYVVVPIGPVGDARSRRICQTVAESLGGTILEGHEEDTTAPPGAAGCLSSGLIVGGDFGPTYVAWSAIEGAGFAPGTASGFVGS